MTIRLPLLALAALLLLAPDAAAQTDRPSGTLTAFRSDAELRSYVRDLADRRERWMEEQRRRAEEEARRWREEMERREAERRARCAPIDAVRVPGATGADGPAVIHGRVTDPDGEPESAVSMWLLAPDLTTTTAEDGTYRLVVPAGRLDGARRVELAAGRVGLEAQRREFTLSPGDSVQADFRLCEETLQLDGLVAESQPMMAPPPPPPPPPAAEAAAAAGESVTNVQHAGVDEGGIVKAHGDHLVILRRGRLFTVRIGDGDLRPVSTADAFGPGIDPAGAWYDEMLVSGGTVVVIGYSYQRGGTEVGLFRIFGDGRLKHRATWHLRSNDYYSSRNYASRLIGDRLIFYTPLHLDLARAAADPDDVLPAVRRWHPGVTDDEWRPVAQATRVYRPARELDARSGIALHSVTACDLGGEEMECEASVVFGPQGRVFYVAPGAVYVWTTDWQRGPDATGAPSLLHRMPLDGGAPSAVGVRGGPVDQFSFLDEGARLNVFVRGEAAGDAMWNAEGTAGGAALLRLPIRAFGDGSDDASDDAYRPLPAPQGHTLQNRFVGGHLLYGTGSGWGRPTGQAAGSTLHVVPLGGGELSRVPLPHGVDRIEALGGDAVAVGTDGSDLHFTTVRLDADPHPVDRFTLAEASQGETRSHGFFYRPDDADSGLLGLPVRGPGRPGYEQLFRSSASILFLRNDGLRLERLGELEGRPSRPVDDACQASCVDWYGNARPLFLRGRVLALLGYEIVEGEVEDGALREARRVDFAPSAKTAGR